MLLAFFAMTSKIIFGRLSETITARWAYVTILIFQAVGLGVMISSIASAMVWVGIGVFGLGMGGVGALTPLVITDLFGLKQFGRIMGLVQMPVTTVGPMVAIQLSPLTDGS